MITKQVEVVQLVEVTVDETKFTPEFMAEFRESFYDYSTVNDHIEHLAQLQARGLINMPEINNRFIEGYGPANEMGIVTQSLDLTDVSILD